MTDLKDTLVQVYGITALTIYDIYIRYNPIGLTEENKDQYWEHTRKFLEGLHTALYRENHKFSIRVIKPESYFKLVITCLNLSFTVTETLELANCITDMTNDISHNILPPYITFRRQTVNCSIKLPPNPPMPQIPNPMFQYGAYGFNPYGHGAYGAYGFNPYGHGAYGAHGDETSKSKSVEEKIKPQIKLKPIIIRSGDLKKSDNAEVVINDDLPLNFYSVYHKKVVNDNSLEHHIPCIYPVSNRPPPPI